MIDSAEKVRVITALKNCLDRPQCRNCPWHECDDVLQENCEIPRSLAEKALALVEELMTVEPKRGRWKFVQYKTNPERGNYHCSQCNWIAEPSNFCPHCGAAMMEGSETNE